MNTIVIMTMMISKSRLKHADRKREKENDDKKYGAITR